MSVEAAIKTLGVAPGVSAADLKAAFVQQRAKLEQKLAQALTDNLKTKYREGISRLEEAYEILTLNAESSDLPSLRTYCRSSQSSSTSPEMKVQKERFLTAKRPPSLNLTKPLAIVLGLLLAVGIGAALFDHNRRPRPIPSAAGKLPTATAAPQTPSPNPAPQPQDPMTFSPVQAVAQPRYEVPEGKKKFIGNWVPLSPDLNGAIGIILDASGELTVRGFFRQFHSVDFQSGDDEEFTALDAGGGSFASLYYDARNDQIVIQGQFSTRYMTHHNGKNDTQPRHLVQFGLCRGDLDPSQHTLTLHLADYSGDNSVDLQFSK